MQSISFEFLRERNEALANLGGLAEAVLFVDPGEGNEYRISGTNEAMLYRRRLKAILDEMVEKSTTLQKIRQGEMIRSDEINRLTSSILASHPGVDLKVLNHFYGRKPISL